MQEIVTALCLIGLFALVPINGERNKPCRYKFNNVCFDKPSADRKPLELNLKLFDPEKNVPIVGALVRQDGAFVHLRKNQEPTAEQQAIYSALGIKLPAANKQVFQSNDL